MAETKAQRVAAEAQLREATTGTGHALSRQQVQAVIVECADIARRLREAEPADLATAYGRLGLRLTDHPRTWLPPSWP